LSLRAPQPARAIESKPLFAEPWKKFGCGKFTPEEYAANPRLTHGQLPGESLRDAGARQAQFPESFGGVFHHSYMCFREEHPYNIQHGCLLGRPRKKYSRGSILDLIIDSRCDLESMYKVYRLGSEVQDHSTSKPFFESDELEGNVRACINADCSAKGAHNFLLTSEKDNHVCMVCACVQRMPNTKSLNREKNCPENEDATIRAERVHERTDNPFRVPPLSARERRAMESARQNVGRDFLNKRKRDKLGIGYAPERCDRNADKAATLAQSLSKEDENRNIKIQSQIELFRQNCSMNINVDLAAHLRMAADTVWLLICEHVNACPFRNTKKCMYNSLKQAHVPSFASCFIDCELKRLKSLQNDHGIASVQVVEIQRLHENYIIWNGQHVNRGHQSSTNSAMGFIKTLIGRVLDVKGLIPPCSDEPASPASSTSSVGPVITRVDSTSGVDECDPKLALRDAVNDVLSSHGRFFAMDIQSRCYTALESIDLSLMDLPDVKQQAIVFAMAVQDAIVELAEAEASDGTAATSITSEHLPRGLVQELNEIAFEQPAFEAAVARVRKAISVTEVVDVML
jgi:hypothetical protein